MFEKGIKYYFVGYKNHGNVMRKTVPLDHTCSQMRDFPPFADVHIFEKETTPPHPHPVEFELELYTK